MVAQAEVQDAAEDQAYGTDSDGYSVDEELARRDARLAKIRALRARLEAEQRPEQRPEQGLTDDQQPTINDQEQRSFADGDARMLLLKRGDYGYAYNAPAAVDETCGVIVAADLTNVASDEGHLPALVDQIPALRETVGLRDPRVREEFDRHAATTGRPLPAALSSPDRSCRAYR